MLKAAAVCVCFTSCCILKHTHSLSAQFSVCSQTSRQTATEFSFLIVSHVISLRITSCPHRKLNTDGGDTLSLTVRNAAFVRATHALKKTKSVFPTVSQCFTIKALLVQNCPAAIRRAFNLKWMEEEAEKVSQLQRSEVKGHVNEEMLFILIYIVIGYFFLSELAGSPL